jgi:hypothetical protein
METWRYKGHLVTHKNGQKDGRWLSSAEYRTPHGEFCVTAFQSGFDGFASEDEAQQATARLIREQIDRSGIDNLFSFGVSKQKARAEGRPAGEKVARLLIDARLHRPKICAGL